MRLRTRFQNAVICIVVITAALWALPRALYRYTKRRLYAPPKEK